MQHIRYLLALFISSLLVSASSFADVRLGDEAYTNGDKVGALAYYIAVEDTPEGAVALANFYLKEDELDDAEDAIVAAVKRAPDNAQLQNFKGVVMSRQAQDAVFSALSYAKKSLNAFATAVELEPTNPSYRSDLIQFYLQAPGFAGGDKSKAWEHIEILQQHDADSAYHAKVAYYQTTQDPVGMESLIKEAVAKSQSAEVLLSAGIIQMNMGQYEESFVTLNSISLLEEQNEAERLAYFGAQYQLSKLAMLSGDYTLEGLEAIQRFMNEAPQYKQTQFAQWAQYRYAMLLHKSGEKEQSVSVLKAIETQDKQLHTEIKKALRDI